MSARSGHLPVAALLGCLLAAPASGQVEQLTWEDPTLPRAVKDADLIVLGRATDVSARGAVYAVERTLVGPDRTGSSIAVTGLHHPQLAERPHVAVGDRAYLLLIGDPRGEGFTIPTPTFGRFPLQRDGERERVIASMGGADTFARLAVAPGRFEALVHAARTGSDPRLLRAAQQTVDAEAPPAEALYWALQGLRLTLGAAPDEVRDGAIPRLRAVLTDPRNADPARIRIRLAAAGALARAGGRVAVGVLLDLAANADAPALRSVAARSVPLALERVRTPRLVQAASRRLAHQAEEADAAPIVFGGAKDPRTNRIESPLAACLGAVADLGRPDGVKAALAALERDDLDAIEAGLTYFVRLGDPGHAAAIATRMRPPGGDAFVNALFGRRLEDLTGQRLGADRQAWQRWAASRQVGPPGPEDGPR